MPLRADNIGSLIISDFLSYIFISAHVQTRAAHWLNAMFPRAFEEVLFLDKYGQRLEFPSPLTRHRPPGIALSCPHQEQSHLSKRAPFHPLAVCVCSWIQTRHRHRRQPLPRPHQKKWFCFDLFPWPGEETNYPFKVKCLKNKSCFASRAAAEGWEERKQLAEMLAR